MSVSLVVALSALGDASTFGGSDAMTHTDSLAANGLTDAEFTGGTLAVRTLIDGAELARLRTLPAEEVHA